jgi:hypothetical protein
MADAAVNGRLRSFQLPVEPLFASARYAPPASPITPYSEALTTRCADASASWWLLDQPLPKATRSACPPSSTRPKVDRTFSTGTANLLEKIHALQAETASTPARQSPEPRSWAAGRSACCDSPGSAQVSTDVLLRARRNTAGLNMAGYQSTTPFSRFEWHECRGDGLAPLVEPTPTFVALGARPVAVAVEFHIDAFFNSWACCRSPAWLFRSTGSGRPGRRPRPRRSRRCGS